MAEEEIVTLLQSLAQESLLLPGKVRVEVRRDPEDNKFLEVAIEARAQYLVTGDKDLLDLKIYRHVRIVRPAAFLKILRRAGKS